MGFEELKPTPVYDTYWKFAAKRQEVFFNRLGGGDYPWTDDSIIRKYKFTSFIIIFCVFRNCLSLF